jgi:hypothetical protein
MVSRIPTNAETCARFSLKSPRQRSRDRPPTSFIVDDVERFPMASTRTALGRRGGRPVDVEWNALRLDADPCEPKPDAQPWNHHTNATALGASLGGRR